MHKYQRHPGILAIKAKYKDLNFSFSSVNLCNLQNELTSLDSRKSVHETDIPTKVLKEKMVIFSPFLLSYFHNIIDSSSFSNHLKLANITPVYKKDSRMIKVTIYQCTIKHIKSFWKYLESADLCTL